MTVCMLGVTGYGTRAKKRYMHRRQGKLRGKKKAKERHAALLAAQPPEPDRKKTCNQKQKRITRDLPRRFATPEQ